MITKIKNKLLPMHPAASNVNNMENRRRQPLPTVDLSLSLPILNRYSVIEI